MKAVVDTNVWVSAFLTPQGTAAQVLVATYSGRLMPLFSTAIMDEYRTVLSRSRFNVEPATLTAFIDHLYAAGHLDDGAPPLPSDLSLPDLSDAPFIELARYAGCPVITGNTRPFPKATGVVALTPAQWVAAQVGG